MIDRGKLQEYANWVEHATSYGGRDRYDPAVLARFEAEAKATEDAILAEIEVMREILIEAVAVIELGVELMTLEQLSEWQGHAAVLHRYGAMAEENQP